MEDRCVARFLACMMIAIALAGAAPSVRADGDAAASEAEARVHFTRGDEHMEKGEYPEAYEAFRKSLAAKRTRGTLAAIASALKQLGRYDEALTYYEQSLQEQRAPSPAFEAKVSREIRELTALVGTMSVAGDGPAGATLSLDNVVRGRLPLSAPLRVSQGTHEVRVEKEGFDPITAKVEVTAGKEAVVQLVAPSKKGRLAVSERHGWPVSVEVDGHDVGTTPWDGLVSVGEHRVRLHGFMDAEALAACTVPGARPGEKASPATEGAKMESRVEMAIVALYEETAVALDAEEQDASLRVDSTPNEASVKIDSRAVGKAPWEGRLPLGKHVIEVSAGGFVSVTQEVRLERRKQREVTVALQRAPERTPEQLAARNLRIGAGVAYGVGVLGLGASVMTGALALDRKERLEQRCPNRQCPSMEQSNLDAASTFGTASTAALVVGGLGAAAGTVLWVLSSPKKAERSAVPSMSAAVGLGTFAVTGRF